jgi:hypothetical protein
LTANALGDSAIRIGFGDTNIYFLLLIVIKGLRIFRPVSLGRACFSGIRKASLSHAAYHGILATPAGILTGEVRGYAAC